MQNGPASPHPARKPRILMLTAGTAEREDASARAHVDWIAPITVLPRFADMKRAVARIGEWRIVALTSANAVDALLSALRSLGHDVRVLFGKRLAVVGDATAARLERYGLSADLVADGSAAALAQAILDAGETFADPADLVLHPRAVDGRTELADALIAAGRRVEIVPAYETSVDEAAIGRALREHARAPYDAIGFLSPKGVNAVVQIFGIDRLRGVRLGAVGETTRHAIEAQGLGPVVVAAHASAGALVAALAATDDEPAR